MKYQSQKGDGIDVFI